MNTLTTTIFIKHRIYRVKSFLLITVKWSMESALRMLLWIHLKFTSRFNPEKTNTILVPLMHGLGDAVIATTLLRELNQIFPKATISCLTTQRTHDVLTDDFPDVDFLLLSSLKQLRPLKNRFDLMILPSRNMDHYIIALLIRPKNILGYNYNLKINKNESHIRRAVRILEALGHQQWQLPVLSRSSEVESQIKKLIHDDMQISSAITVTMIVGGRWKSKIYKAEYYNELIAGLLSAGNVRIILIGKDLHEMNFKYRTSKSIFNLINQTDIKQLKGIIGLSDLVIGPDGGVLNIAIAMKKRIIGLFSSVDPGTIVPEEYRDMIIHNIKCPFQPCYNEEHEPYCPFNNPPCIDIKPEMIFEKIKTQIKLIIHEKI